jgi:hypothetical protein
MRSAPRPQTPPLALIYAAVILAGILAAIGINRWLHDPARQGIVPPAGAARNA